ncbi:MAG: multiheme c-type cytochrome, partial [Tepidisphaeraceae bacterium]
RGWRMENGGWRRRFGAILHLLSSILVLMLVVGCDRKQGDATKSNKPLYLIASGDTAGWIMPCGCTSNQSGGLLRRGSYLDEMRGKGETIYLDAGGAAGGTSPYHQVKFDAILRGEKQMGIVAHNLGKSELALGPQFLRDAAKNADVTLISANTTDASGSPLAVSQVAVQKGARRFIIVGVVSPKFSTDQVKISDPRQSVLSTHAPLKGQYDSLIVLAYLPEDELQQLAQSLPEADVIIGGPTGQAIPPRNVGPTLLAAATNKGKFLVQLERPAGADKSTGNWSGKIVEMGQGIADHAPQVANLKTYLAELEKRNFTAAESGLALQLPPNLPADYRIAGSASCLSCHKDDHAQWAQSKHGHAWQTLEQKQMHVDSYCMQCHTTGFGLPGGFDSRTASPLLVNVGCESCHGPSQAHVERPRTRTTFAAADQCVRCHDHENSPGFVYAAYWPRIRHGEKKSAAAGAEIAQ